MSGTTGSGGSLSELITARVATHDPQVRAAVLLVTDTILGQKIAVYVKDDGWVQWNWLAADLAAGLPWSSGEKRLARLACSLAGQLPAWLSEVQVTAWSLAELFEGVDEANRVVVLRALTFAVTGRLPGGLMGGDRW